jgi:peptidyl-prolyl cis-trans isomerase D
MLEAMRGHKNSWVTWGVGGFIALTMTFWGLGTSMLGRVHPVATVDGKRILADQVDRRAIQIRETLQQLYGANAAEILKSMNVRQQALDALIESQLVMDEAHRLGIVISTNALQMKIASEPAFQQDGQFDFDRYQEVLQYQGVQPHEYEDEVRDEMISDTLRTMVDSGVQITDGEARHAYNLRNEKIGLSYIQLSWSSFAAGINPNAQQISDYYNQFKEQFREPERIKIEFIHYEPHVLAAKITPSDQEIKDYYDRNLKTRFTHPEQVHAQHILVAVPAGATAAEKDAAKKKAIGILAQAHKGDFAKLAAKYSDDPSNKNSGGDLGTFSRGQMIKPFEDAVFKMKPGEIEIVETNFGYHIVKLDEHKDAHVDTIDQVKPQIIEAIRDSAGTRLSREALNQDLSDALAGASLESIAKKRGMDVVEAPAVSRDELIPGTQDSHELIDAGFRLEVGQPRGVPAGSAPYLIRLVARDPSHIPPLKDIQGKVVDAYVKSAAEDKAHAEATRLLKQIKSWQDLATVAAANKLQVKTADPFTRITNDVPGIGQFPEVADAASVAPTIPGVIDNVMEHGGDSYIFEVTSRADPTDDEWKSDQKSFVEEFQSRRRALAWQQFLNQLRSQAKIGIDADQLGASQASM